MILNKRINKNLFQQCLKTITKGQTATIFNRQAIGNREWVGFGVNGSASYFDAIDMPFPAVRFKENTNDLCALREKEKGDWRKLSLDEKKTLYRASFRQTIVESLASTQDWKSVVGFLSFGLGVACWLYMILAHHCTVPLPETFTEEYRRKILRKILDLRIGGLSHKWDYEKDDWKK